MQTCLFDETLLGSGKIFPSSIESLDWVGYHATSSYYSGDIDVNGFRLTKPLPVADLELLICIGQRHARDTSDVQGFIGLKSISFTPVSELALYFARPDSFGGQGLLHVKGLIDELFQKKRDELNVEESTHLKALEENIAAIRAAIPVIYAVCLEGLPRTAFGKHTTAVHAYCEIPAERVIAKMLIDKPVDYLGIDNKKHVQQLRQILQSSGNHYIKRMPLS